MSKRFLVVLAFLLPLQAMAIGYSGTQFDVFVPPNENISRRVFLVVTNVSSVANTVSIVDDGADGDADDSISVTLQFGESQVIRIADGAVNDDMGGKADGDFYRIQSQKPVVAFMATQSNWAHDWMPAEGKSAIGKTFVIYNPPSGGNRGDLNIYAYEDGTDVSVVDISTNTVTATGKTAVNVANGSVLLDARLNQGEDLNVRKGNMGIDVMTPGRTYLVRASGLVSVQFGHLGGITNGSGTRDGAGYVPSANGTSAGSLFFFSVPTDLGRPDEKELRVVCPNGGTVTLQGANSFDTQWVNLSSGVVAPGGHLDFVGATNSLFRDKALYRLTVSPAWYGCTVWAGNWFETGALGTSDDGSSVASDDGLHIGREFTTYIGPPGRQLDVVNPIGEATNLVAPAGTYASHLYVSGREANTTVTVRDVDTNGAVVQYSFSVGEGSYYDYVIDSSTYALLKSQGRRPYVRLMADRPISVVNGNFNDNWLTVFAANQMPEPRAGLVAPASVQCGQSMVVQARCSNSSALSLSNLEMRVRLPNPLQATVGSVSAGATLESDGAFLWSDAAFAGGAERLVSLTVTAACGSSCISDLGPGIRVECQAVSGTQVFADVASTPVEVVQPGVVVSLFQSRDVPDYTAATPNSRVEIDLGFSQFPAGATVAVERVTNSSVPTGGVTVATFTGAGAPLSTVVQDPYSLHYEASRYYRLRITVAGCTRVEGPLVVRTSSGASSGFDSGLESNGRKAAALAQRAIARLQNPTWLAPPAMHTQKQQLGDRDLLESLPADGPFGSAPYDVTPGDLPAITNARRVAAIDYMSGAGRRVGSVLVVETTGELYEHSKGACDRAHGSELERLESVPATDGVFIRAVLADQRARHGEYSLEFKLYRESNGEYVAHHAWLGEQYPPPASSQQVLNVQVWSAIPGADVWLGEEVIKKVSARWGTTSHIPAAFLRTIAVAGGDLKFAVEGGSAEQRVRVTRRLETGSEETSEHQVAVGQQRLTFPLFQDATLELLGADGRVVDRGWASDGAWAVVNGGGTVLDSSLVCQSPSQVRTDGAFSLAGCGRLKAQLAGNLGLARHVGGHLAGLDLSPYRGIAFRYRSSREVRLCFEGAGLAAADAPCFSLPKTFDFESVELPFSAFRGESCRTPTWPSLSAMTFMLQGEGEATVDVDNLALLRTAPAAPDGQVCQSKALSRCAVSDGPWLWSSLLLLYGWRRRLGSRRT